MASLQYRFKEVFEVDVGFITKNARLSNYSWWQIGGCADLLVEPTTVAQVQTLMRLLLQLQLPYVVIGDGSNLLFDDAGLRGVVVKIGRGLSGFSISGTKVVAGAGVFVPRLVRSLGCAGLSGLEHAIGIPGTLGGLVVMNGGSQQKGVGSRVDRVWTVSRYGEIIEYDQQSCQFSYRHSVLQKSDNLVVGIRLQLDREEPSTIRRAMLATLRSRRKKFPIKQPNCGSVFLSNPAMYGIAGPPGKVIEDCGLKGLRIGDAMISEQHANFIINVGQASSRDVLELISQVRQGVLEKTGHELNCEVKYVTPACRFVPAHKVFDNHGIV